MCVQIFIRLRCGSDSANANQVKSKLSTKLNRNRKSQMATIQKMYRARAKIKKSIKKNQIGHQKKIYSDDIIDKIYMHIAYRSILYYFYILFSPFSLFKNRWQTIQSKINVLSDSNPYKKYSKTN